jgi:subtilisin family serine protease
MSLGGGFSSSLNTAATNLVNSGVYLAVAAGNSNANACSFSPAAASSGVLTVAASTSSDAKASYSNYGSCVEIYARARASRPTG